MYQYVKSSQFKTGKAITDVLVVTKKGMEKGGLFRGVIIPNTQNEAIRDVIRDYKGQVGTAHHGNWGEDNMVTHLQSTGYGNRFGWYLLLDKVFHIKEFDLDIGGPGWLQRRPVKDISELKEILGMKGRK